MDIKLRFGNRIKELRKQKGFSQEKLANLADIDRTYLPTIEKGERNVSIEVVERLVGAVMVMELWLTNADVPVVAVVPVVSVSGFPRTIILFKPPLKKSA